MQGFFLINTSIVSNYTPYKPFILSHAVVKILHRNKCSIHYSISFLLTVQNKQEYTKWMAMGWWVTN